MLKITKNRFLALFTILTFLFVLAGCGNSESSGKEKSSEKETITIKHAMGESKVPENPKRVVVLTNEGTEALLALGIKPVGAVQSWTGNPWYNHIKDDMKDVEVVGTEMEPSLETIASLKPDLIIGNKVRQEKVYDKLNAIAPTVFTEELRGDWKENFKVYAKTVNKEKEGNKVLSDFDNRVAGLKEELGDETNKKVSLVRFMAGETRIYHKDTFAGIILDQLGFKRPEEQNKADFAEMGVTDERIPAMDGDVLFYFTYDTGDKKGNEVEKEWTNKELFKNLSVSKNGQVYKVDDAVWNTAGGVIAADKMLDDIEKYFLNKK
jgi:iron complex transport system substrate-binding protein